MQTGDDIDTWELPMVTHSEGDYGPCLTMTLAIKDPESGAYNAAFIKAFYDFEDSQRLRITIHSTDSERALKYYEDRDLPMPIVAILGHHPALYLARWVSPPTRATTTRASAATSVSRCGWSRPRPGVRTSWSPPTQRSSSRAWCRRMSG